MPGNQRKLSKKARTRLTTSHAEALPLNPPQQPIFDSFDFIQVESSNPTRCFSVQPPSRSSRRQSVRSIGPENLDFCAARTWLTTHYSEADGALLYCRYVIDCNIAHSERSPRSLGSHTSFTQRSKVLSRTCWDDRISELTGTRSRHCLRHQLGTSSIHEEYAFYILLFKPMTPKSTHTNGLGDEFKNDPRNPYAKKAAH